MEHIAPAYCPRCGTQMPAPSEGTHPTCPNCDYIAYPDPKVATGVIVTRGEDRSSEEAASTGPKGQQSPEGALLLVRRNHEPALGRWAFPSGYVDAGEVVEEAAIREVFEETGVTITIDRLIGVYSEPGNPVVFVAYAGHVVSGEPVAGDEAFEVGWFSIEELPPLAFPHDDQIIADWRRASASAR